MAPRFVILFYFAIALFCFSPAGCKKGQQAQPAEVSEKAGREEEDQPVSEGEGDSEPVSEKDLVKKAIEELFGYCKTDDYEKAANYIVYRGSDESRKWKDICRYIREDEKEHVQDVCERIKAYVAHCDAYEFGEFEVEEESEGLWLVWEVYFTMGSKKEKVYFAFLEVKGQYALGDID